MTGWCVLSLFRTSTPSIAGLAQYPYSLQADNGTPSRIAWFGANRCPEKCGRDDEPGNTIQFSFSCKTRLRFPVSVQFFFSTSDNEHPNRKEREPIISYSGFPLFSPIERGKSVVPRYLLTLFIKLHLFLFRLKGSHGTLALWVRRTPLNEVAVPDPSSLARETSSPQEMGITGPSER